MRTDLALEEKGGFESDNVEVQGWFWKKIMTKTSDPGDTGGDPDGERREGHGETGGYVSDIRDAGPGAPG